MAETKPPCYCGRNDETGYMELCPEHEGEMFDHMMDTDRISALQAQLAARDQQIARLREALESVQWGDERYCDDPARPESGVLYNHCPDCGNPEDDGRHAEGCIVGIALADTPAAKPDQRDQQIARLREDVGWLKAALRLLGPSTDNEGSQYPWWAIVKRAGLGRHEVLAGPFFSRPSAERQRKARLYDYGEKSLVYCFSGHESRAYVALREMAALSGVSEPTKEGK